MWRLDLIYCLSLFKATKSNSLMDFQLNTGSLGFFSSRIMSSTTKKHNYMSRHGYHLILRIGLNSWCVSRSENSVFSLSAKLEFIRKYWIGLLFRRFKFRNAN